MDVFKIITIKISAFIIKSKRLYIKFVDNHVNIKYNKKKVKV